MTFLRPGTLLLLIAGAIAAAAQNNGTCAAPLAFPAKSGTELTIDSRSGEVVVAGSDKDGIRVTCSFPDSGRAEEANIRFEQTGDFGKLVVRGGPSSNFQIRIEVPRRTDLKLRVTAGELRVDQVSGDKDLNLGAGEITVNNVNPTEYRSVKATVDVGGVSASAFGADKGGFFRTLEKNTPGGHYRLRAHLASGNIQLDN